IQVGVWTRRRVDRNFEGRLKHIRGGRAEGRAVKRKDRKRRFLWAVPCVLPTELDTGKREFDVSVNGQIRLKTIDRGLDQGIEIEFVIGGRASAIAQLWLAGVARQSVEHRIVDDNIFLARSATFGAKGNCKVPSLEGCSRRCYRAVTFDFDKIFNKCICD